MTTLDDCLVEMHRIYLNDPVAAVRGQAFIKQLHDYLGTELSARLTADARRRGIKVVFEAKILGSHKPKDVDVSIIDPENGPLMMIGVRSQMSSIGKNALNYYEGIIGECISLQDRFPMSTIGYIYLMPLRAIKDGRQKEFIDHGRYARMYAAITGRAGQEYKSIRGIYDQFSYLVIDFAQNPPAVRDDLVAAAVPDSDLAIATFIDRIIDTFQRRHLFVEYFT
ncbi:MAG TPA: hypothetical protein VFQ77_01065 [Pseudonocardiaceae bacterium]|jgi:hypothetical protein|nr:hypothetical protein [Pseudonocardiaceae bacterium]